MVVFAVDFLTKLGVTLLLPPAILLTAALAFWVPLVIADRRDTSHNYAERHAKRELIRYRFFRCALFTLFLM
jgi:hypothetical protein